MLPHTKNSLADRQPETASFLNSRVVMTRFGYQDNSAFWAFVRAQGVPFVRLNARKLVFDAASLEAWISKRTVGTPRV